MKNYEVIIERSQPSCGGKSPKNVTVVNVATEDPAEYVKQQEQAQQVEVSRSPAGEIVVEVTQGLKYVKYSFTED